MKKSPQEIVVGIFCYFSANLLIANLADKGFHSKKQSDWKILSRFLLSTRPSFLIWFWGNLGAISIETMCTMDKIDVIYRGFSPKFMLSRGFLV